jgi:uncharacterized protein YceK
MKKLLLVLLISLYGCTTVDVASGPMEGSPTNIQVRGMKEMCEREPDSELCNAD